MYHTVSSMIKVSPAELPKMALTNYSWSFNPIVSEFPATVLPNVALWNATNGVDLDYQIQVSWPLGWTSRDEAKGPALTM